MKSVSQLLSCYKNNRHVIESYIKGDKKTREEFSYKKSYDTQFLGLTIGLYIFLLIITISVYIYAFILLYNHGKTLTKTVFNICIAALLAGIFIPNFGLIGPVITIALVLTYKNGNK